jgi:hypothetical protein
MHLTVNYKKVLAYEAKLVKGNFFGVPLWEEELFYMP